MTRDLAIALVLDELERANKAFRLFKSNHEGHAVIEEEFDEMWDEIKRNNHLDAGRECVQLAAMAVKYLMSRLRDSEGLQLFTDQGFLIETIATVGPQFRVRVRQPQDFNGKLLDLTHDETIEQ